MAGKSKSHTNNINILPGIGTIIRKEDQNIRIDIDPSLSFDSCFDGGIFYIGGTGASNSNTGLTPNSPLLTWNHFRYNIIGCKVIDGNTIVKIRPGTYSEPLDIQGLTFSNRGYLTVMATDESLYSSSNKILSHGPVTGEFIRTGTVSNDVIILSTVEPTWTRDLHVGRRIKLIGYPNSIRTIFSHTDAAITLNAPFQDTGLSSISFLIEEPKVIFNSDYPCRIAGNSGPPDIITNRSRIQIVGLKYTSNTTAGFAVGNKGLQIRMCACVDDSKGAVWRENDSLLIDYRYTDISGNLIDTGHGYVFTDSVGPGAPDPFLITNILLQGTNTGAFYPIEPGELSLDFVFPATDTYVDVHFSEAVDISTVIYGSSLKLVDRNNSDALVPATIVWNIDNDIVTIQPTSIDPDDGAYAVIATSAILSDVAPQPLSNPADWDYTTTQEPCVDPAPAVLSQDATALDEITIVFASPCEVSAASFLHSNLSVISILSESPTFGSVSATWIFEVDSTVDLGNITGTITVETLCGPEVIPLSFPGIIPPP